MVSIKLDKTLLLKATGKKLSDDALCAELEQMKVEVESIDDCVLSVDVTGDRPDLLGVNGVARALAGRLGVSKGIPALPLAKKPALQVIVEKDARAIRPFVVGAVVEGVRFSDDSIAEIFQLQDKLDLTVGRKRKRVSIGLYDLDKLTPPFHFKALPPSTSFTPLKSDKKMSLDEILSEHPTGVENAKLLAGRKNYPCLVDAAGEILSLIPIINNVASAVTEKTTRIFIDHTGTEEYACNSSLNILCQEFADAGAKVSSVEIVYPDKTVLTPDSTPHKLRVAVVEVNKALGVSFTGKQVADLLTRQRINATAQGDWVDAQIPAYRADFLHPVDLIEEVALAYGYNNFEPLKPTAYTVGSVSQATMRENFVRDFLVGAGFLEVNTYITTNEARIRASRSQAAFAEILNPVSEEYAALRSELLPNLLNVLSKNTHVPYPQNLFEAGEVIVPNDKLPERMETRLRACAIACHTSASLTEVASVLNELAKRVNGKLFLKKISSPQFIPGRSAEVNFGGKTVGIIGEIHPEILSTLGISMPAAAFEIDLP
ncbi:phenylalanine--tRNA ligase subunit beta [Candidatus Micrarchaeota archaeon CG1_02_55_22]|nr:MAG: phenylalanine--tRNA ligase subunit beta [Candidatus Micrarchaeota archaeon CG1_02_55_22]